MFCEVISLPSGESLEPESLFGLIEETDSVRQAEKIKALEKTLSSLSPEEAFAEGLSVAAAAIEFPCLCEDQMKGVWEMSEESIFTPVIGRIGKIYIPECECCGVPSVLVDRVFALRCNECFDMKFLKGSELFARCERCGNIQAV